MHPCRIEAQTRDALAGKIPAGARRLLDVGCHAGGLADTLRKRGVREIYGIEPGIGGAAGTEGYASVVNVSLEEAEPGWERFFDAILFDGVFERLKDPARALLKVSPWLARGGVVVACVKNQGYAEVIGDLLRGRFVEVAGASIASRPVRLFTRQALVELFEACGYERPEVSTLETEPARPARQLLERLRRVPGACADLAAVGFLAVACVEGGR